jgi:cobalt-zinc-cadmium efflux system outer membrane protein
MSRKLLITLFIILLVVSGCKTYETSFTLPESVPLVKGYPEMKDALPSRDTLQVPDTLTVTDALRLVLMNNPELSVYAWEIRAYEADVLQASLIPNPEASLEMENFAGNRDYRGFRGAEITVTAGQLIEMSGKRGKRTEVARLSGELAGWDYQAVRLKIFTETMGAFYEVLTLQQQLDQAIRMQSLAEELEQAVDRRVKAGAMSPAEYSRARIETGKAAMEVQSYRYQLRAAKKRLASLWGAQQAGFREVRGVIMLRDTLPSLDELTGRLMQNPALARMATEKKLREAQFTLERARGVPDPFVSAGYRRLQEVGANAMVAGVSIPVPFFNRNQGEIKKAAIRLQQVEDLQRSMQLSLWQDLVRLNGELQGIIFRVQSLQETIIPQAEQSMEVIRQGYRQGRFTFLDVLDAQRTLFQAYTEYLQDLADYRQKVSAIEMLTGAPLFKNDEKI